MGRRSKVDMLRKRLARLRATQQKDRIKHGPWACPWCYQPRMFHRLESHGQLVLFGCGGCQQGERLPRPPNFEIIDLYNVMCDSTVTGKVPEFRYAKLTERQLDFLQSKISLGVVTAEEVIEDDRESEEEDD